MKTVVFDWDLTLWNSWDIHVWLMGRTAAALGVATPEVSVIAREFHRPFFEHLTWFFGADLERIVEVYQGFYRQVVREKAHLFPGVPDTLGSLKSQGYQLAIFSDKRHAFGVSEVAMTTIGGLLDHALFLEDGRPPKPDPLGLIQVLEAIGADPRESLYIGDSHQDVECAHRAGVTSGAALWASVNRDQVLSRQPHYRWERPEEVLESLRRLAAQ